MGPQGGRSELASQHLEHDAREALEELHHDVADRGVADDDVGRVVRQVTALDVADEAQVAIASSSCGRLLDALLALAAPPRRSRAAPRVGSLDAQHALREERAHLRVLREVEAGGVGRGADVEEHERARGR